MLRQPAGMAYLFKVSQANVRIVIGPFVGQAGAITELNSEMFHHSAGGHYHTQDVSTILFHNGEWFVNLCTNGFDRVDFN